MSQPKTAPPPTLIEYTKRAFMNNVLRKQTDEQQKYLDFEKAANDKEKAVIDKEQNFSEEIAELKDTKKNINELKNKVIRKRKREFDIPYYTQLPFREESINIYKYSFKPGDNKNFTENGVYEIISESFLESNKDKVILYLTYNKTEYDNFIVIIDNLKKDIDSMQAIINQHNTDEASGKSIAEYKYDPDAVKKNVTGNMRRIQRILNLYTEIIEEVNRNAASIVGGKRARKSRKHKKRVRKTQRRNKRSTRKH
jgi:hypothetical protein